MKSGLCARTSSIDLFVVNGRRSGADFFQEPGDVLAQILHGSHTFLIPFNFSGLKADTDVPMRGSGDDHFVDEEEVVERFTPLRALPLNATTFIVGLSLKRKISFACHGVEDDSSCGILIFSGTDHQVVKVHVAPVAAEPLAQVVGALSIHFAEPLLNVGAGFEPFFEALNALAQGSIYKSVERIAFVLQDALCAAADDHAVAGGIGFFNDVAGKLRHGMRVEYLGVVERSGTDGDPPDCLFVEAAQP